METLFLMVFLFWNSLSNVAKIVQSSHISLTPVPHSVNILYYCGTLVTTKGPTLTTKGPTKGISLLTELSGTFGRR